MRLSDSQATGHPSNEDVVTLNEVHYITVSFNSQEFGEEWDRCREQIPKTYMLI